MRCDAVAAEPDDGQHGDVGAAAAVSDDHDPRGESRDR